MTLWLGYGGIDRRGRCPLLIPQAFTAMTTTCLLAWAAVLLLLPITLVLRATESRHTRIRRWRAQGLSWRACADRLHCSPSTARRWALG